MNQEQTRTAVREREMNGPSGDPFAENQGDLLRQANQFGSVAREAREDCRRGAEAEKELKNRANRSAQ